VKAADLPSTLRNHLSFERLLLLLFLAALLVRLYHLDLKLFHHDEAVHAWFSYRLLTAAMFSLFGDSDLVARVAPAVLGALLIPLLYPLKQLGYLSSRQALVAALFIAASPEMIYFSRFLRNDIFVVFFTLLMLVALLLYLDRHKPGYLIVAAAAAGLGMSAKENMPIVLLIVGAYGAYALWRGAIRLPDRWVRHFLAAGLVTVGVMALFYSSFGQHPEVLMDGWLRAIEHWTAMHQQERLGGPPSFYLILLLLYDLPILVLAAFATGQFLIRAPRQGQDTRELEEGWGARLRHAIPQLFRNSGTAEGSYGIEDRNQEFTRFCIVWLVASLAVYAYIGEKVPWLIIHQLLPLIFVAVYRMGDRKTVVAVLSAIFLIGMTWHVAFTPADINEPIVQVQNSEEMRDVMALIDASEKVAVITDHYWPLPWYYRGEAGEKISYLSKNRTVDYLTAHGFDLIIAHDQESFASIPGFQKETYVHSYWFSTSEQRERALEYYIHRDGEPGTLNWDVFVKAPPNS
jgi:uncharacterized protein (TIGR03663 family)